MDDTERDWLTEQEVTAFVGKKADYYKEKWMAYPNSSLYKGWNGIALLFFFEWAAYRKLYLEAILTFLGVLLVSLFLTFLPFDTDFFAELLAQLSKVLFFLFANGLYRKKALRTVRKTHDMSAADKTRYLEKKGGTSRVGPVVCILLELAFASLSFL